jgi:hypothetical protein
VRSRIILSIRLACALACIALASIVWVRPASAALSPTLYAAPTGGNGASCAAADPCSLGAALTNTGSDTGNVQILLAAGTYAASGGYALPAGSATAVTIQAEPGDPTTPVLSGNNANGVLSVPASTIALILDGLTIEDGAKTVTTSTANYGAGIDDNAGAMLTVENSTIANNSVVANGGGVEGAPAIWAAFSLSISNSTIEGNTMTGTNATQAMGAVVSGSALTVTNSTFEHNSASTAGNYVSGNLVAGMGAMFVTGSSFIDNSVSASGSSGSAVGGAIGLGGSTTTIADSTFIGNSATGGNGQGGAIAAAGNPFSLSASTFSANTADHGSAISLETPEATITDSSFAANSGAGATIGGLGGSALLGGDLLVGNAGNECPTTGITLIDGGYDVSDDTTCPFTSTGSIKGWPGVGTLSPLGWYGGPAETIVPSTSSALTMIPSGTTVTGTLNSQQFTETLCSDPLPTFLDERGLSRPYGTNSDCTVGATEAVPVVPGLWNANTATFQVGVASSTSLAEAGVAHATTPTYSALTGLPQGLTLVDNGNGTAAISGTPAAGTAGTYTAMIEAANGGGDLSNIDAVTITIQPAATQTTPPPTPTPTTPKPTPVSTRISGPAAGAIYFGTAPAAVCARGCTIAKHTSKTANGTLVAITATASGAATTTLKYTLASATLPFRPAAGELYATGSGRRYTLVIVSKTKPKLLAAVASPKRPQKPAGAFKPDGKAGRTARWKASVTLALVAHKPAKWHVGILVGKKLDVLTLVS